MSAGSSRQRNTGRNKLFDLVSNPIPELLDAFRVDERRSLVFRRNEDIAVINEPIERAYFIRSGWACCHWRLSDGRRQILYFLLEGDMIGVLPLLNNIQEQRQKLLQEPTRTNYTVTALTPVKVIPIDPDLAEIAIDSFPHICGTLPGKVADKTNKMLALRLTTLGQCNARERMAVLFQELWQRQIKLGLADEIGFSLPINQTAIGDALGLTAVHVSRTLSKLEEDGILSTTRDGPKRIRVYNGARLHQIADAVTGPNGVSGYAR